MRPGCDRPSHPGSHWRVWLAQAAAKSTSEASSSSSKRSVAAKVRAASTSGLSMSRASAPRAHRSNLAAQAAVATKGRTGPPKVANEYELFTLTTWLLRVSTGRWREWASGA